MMSDKLLTKWKKEKCSSMVCDKWLDSHNIDVPALEFFSKLIADDVKPSGDLFVPVLVACSHLNLLDGGHRPFSTL